MIIILCLTRLGFGSDGDAWRVARATEKMWQSGEYVKSRTTGFPLFEIMMVPLINCGSWYLSNITVAAFGLGFVAAILALYKRGFIQNPIGVLILTAFLPVFVKNSSSTMDYIPAICLLMWSYYNLLNKKHIWSAILIGLSCGFRLTSIVFVLPSVIYMVVIKEKWERIILFAATAAVMGALSFSPSLIKYGMPNPYASISIEPKLQLVVGGYYFLMLYGVIQGLILFAVFAYAFIRRDKAKDSHCEKYFQISAIVCVLLLFTIMSDEPEYLLPMVPMIALYLEPRLSPRSYLLLGCVLLTYHFVRLETLGGESGNRNVEVSIRPGYTINDIQQRRNILKIREAATNFKTPIPVALLIGDVFVPTQNEKWIFDDHYRMYRQKDGLLYLAGRIRDESRLAKLNQDGFRIVVSNDMKWEYLRTNNKIWQKYVEITYDLNQFLGIQDPVKVR